MARLPQQVDLLGPPPLGPQQALHSSELDVVLPDGGVAVGLDDELASRVCRRWIHPRRQSVDDGFDVGVAETVGFVGGREDDNGGLGPTERAELAGLFEEASAPLGEGDL